MKKCAFLVVSLLLWAAALSPATASEILGMAEIRGIDNLSTAAFELTRAVGQPMPKEMVSMGIHAALGTLPGLGIEPNGTLRAVWVEGGMKGFVFLLLPVANDGADYLASLGQSGWSSLEDSSDDLVHMAPPDNTSLPWEELFFLKRGSTLIAATTADQARIADSLRDQLPPILPAEGVAVLQIRPAALAKVFGPQLTAQMQQAFQAAPGASPDTRAIGDIYARGYLALAGQTEELVLGLGVADNQLNFHSRATPVADSLLAQWLATVQPPSEMASVVNLPDALFVETANLGNVDLLAPAYFRYMDEMLAILPKEIDAATMTAYMDQSKAYWRQMAGDIGIALLPPVDACPIRAVEYIALKDSAALRPLAAQTADMANTMMKSATALQPTQPVTLTLESGDSREYRDIPVDRLTYHVKPGPALQSIWAADRELEIPLELAWLPTGLLVSIGGADLTDALVDRALDGTSAPVSDRAAWQSFFPNPEPRLVDLSHVAIFDSLRDYLQRLDAATGEDFASAVPAGAGNLESLSYVALDGWMTRVRFGLNDLGAIAQKIMEAQQKAMAARFQAMPDPAADLETDLDQPVETEEADDAESWIDDAEEDTEGEAGEDIGEIPESAPAGNPEE